MEKIHQSRHNSETNWFFHNLPHNRILKSEINEWMDSSMNEWTREWVNVHDITETNTQSVTALLRDVCL